MPLSTLNSLVSCPNYKVYIQSKKNNLMRPNVQNWDISVRGDGKILIDLIKKNFHLYVLRLSLNMQSAAKFHRNHEFLHQRIAMYMYNKNTTKIYTA